MYAVIFRARTDQPEHNYHEMVDRMRDFALKRYGWYLGYTVQVVEVRRQYSSGQQDRG